jgi:hypothetical protein
MGADNVESSEPLKIMFTIFDDETPALYAYLQANMPATRSRRRRFIMDLIIRGMDQGGNAGNMITSSSAIPSRPHETIAAPTAPTAEPQPSTERPQEDPLIDEDALIACFGQYTSSLK